MLFIVSLSFAFLLYPSSWEHVKNVLIDAGPQFAFVAGVSGAAIVYQDRQQVSFERECRELNDHCTELDAEVNAFTLLFVLIRGRG